MKALINLINPWHTPPAPAADEVIEKDLEEAKLERLRQHKLHEYHGAMVKMLDDRITRLTKEKMLISGAKNAGVTPLRNTH